MVRVCGEGRVSEGDGKGVWGGESEGGGGGGSVSDGVLV